MSMCLSPFLFEKHNSHVASEPDNMCPYSGNTGPEAGPLAGVEDTELGSSLSSAPLRPWKPSKCETAKLVRAVSPTASYKV